MKRFLVILCLAPLLAQAQTYKIDPAHSRIAFSVRHLLGTARGEFHKFSGTIEPDPQQPEKSFVNVRIDVASIDTGIQKRDKHLLSEDFFNASRFSEITFRSRSVKQTARDSGDITGDLSMHGVTRSIVLHVKQLSRTRWSVTTDPIHRKDFGLMFSTTAEAVSGIGQDVVPSIEIEATRAD